MTTKRTYGAYSGQLLGQETKLGTTDLYRVGSMGYLGEKLTQMTDAGTGTSYSWAYDTGGRLVTATATASASAGMTQNYSHSFAFSPVWNLASAQVSWNGAPTSTQGYSYSGTDQATQGPGGYQPAYALTYDGMGNIVDRRIPGSPTAAETLTYTAEGYLRSIVRGTSTDEVLYYDALGNLAYRRSGSYLWFYAGEHATITATTTCTADPCTPTAGTVRVNVHVLLAGARIATVRTTPGQTTDQAFGNVLYYHRDRQGSVVATTTTGGSLGAQYRYGPYGELDRYAGNEATAGSDLGYTGGLRLTGGLIHLKARVYDPSFRRFLQADIVDPLRYTYTRGDPSNHEDPSGRMPSGFSFAFFAQFVGSGSGARQDGGASGMEPICGNDEICTVLDEQIVSSGTPRRKTAMEQLEADQAYLSGLSQQGPKMTRLQARQEIVTGGATAVRLGLLALKPFRTVPIGIAVSTAVSFAFTGNATTALGNAIASDIATASLVAIGMASGASMGVLVVALSGAGAGVGAITYLVLQSANGEAITGAGLAGAAISGGISAGTLGMVEKANAQRMIGAAGRALGFVADVSVALDGTSFSETMQSAGVRGP